MGKCSCNISELICALERELHFLLGRRGSCHERKRCGCCHERERHECFSEDKSCDCENKCCK